MATKHTTNYKLCQWEASDKVDHLDFNADNLAIDTAIKAAKDAADGARTQAQQWANEAKTAAQAAQTKANAAYSASNPACVFGRIVGDGQSKQFINLGFTPRAVLVVPADGKFTDEPSSVTTRFYGGLAITGHNARASSSGETAWSQYTIVGIVTGGFQVGYDYEERDYYNICINQQNRVSYYIAWK